MKKKLPIYSHEQAQTYLYLKSYIPNFLNLLNPTPKQLRVIRDKIELRYSQVGSELSKNIPFEAETTLIDLIWKVEERHLHSFQFVNFIDKACLSISKNIPDRLLPKLRRTLMQLVMNFDKAKSRYRSYVAELSVLNTLISSESFDLIEVEYKLPNGKSADYAFNSRKGLILVEVESFDISTEKISTEEDLENHINARVEQKLVNKLGGLPKEWNTPFYLIQVIWADYMKLYELRGYFKKTSKYANIAVKPMSIAQFFDQKGQIPRYAFLTTE
ncbi:MAG: hypothetical protein FVQ80_14200 [Planctomycetes bacterium]|nr:hypothetical protein [Planctomycetota bacterium]